MAMSPQKEIHSRSEHDSPPRTASEFGNLLAYVAESVERLCLRCREPRPDDADADMWDWHDPIGTPVYLFADLEGSENAGVRSKFRKCLENAEACLRQIMKQRPMDIPDDLYDICTKFTYAAPGVVGLLQGCHGRTERESQLPGHEGELIDRVEEYRSELETLKEIVRELQERNAADRLKGKDEPSLPDASGVALIVPDGLNPSAVFYDDI